ncbi:MAG: methionine--tRNA ligase [Rickettsiales bacterium]|jgi:methionyl-tRNA synthetase|nr:methionine--tRNA ligase [Rickettsiales bacterium]
MSEKTFFVTTPIYYVSAEPHIGSSYPTIFADVLARFHKLDNYDVKFLTGTDEHGQKVEQSAKDAGQKPKDFVDELSIRFREILKTLDLQPTHFDVLNDNFIRTTDPIHKKQVQDVWRILVKNDWIYRGQYDGWYCVSDEAYYTEDELVKNVDGEWRTTLGKKVEWKVEESYFFRLSEFQELLLNTYKKFPDLVRPEGKKTEVIAFVSGINAKEYEQGKAIKKDYLRDLSVSRNNFDWGIKIPVDTENNELLDGEEWKNDIKKEDKHVIYVWLDALFNYIAALGYSTNNKDYQKYWLNSSKKINLVGKDILKFHAVYWPAFLIACNYTREEIKKLNNQPLEDFKKYIPSSVFAHGWLTNEGQKISKSLNNGIYPAKEIEWLQTEFNIDNSTARDYFKYYLLNAVKFGNDGDYSRVKLVEKINGDLANKIGNLTKRTLDLIYKNFDKKIPIVKDFDKIVNVKIDNFRKHIDDIDINDYVNELLQIAEHANKYIDENKPWELVKSDKEKSSIVLYSVANIILKIAILLQPFVPYLAKNILEGLGYDNIIGFDKIDDNLRGNVIEEPKIIIPRL